MFRRSLGVFLALLLILSVSAWISCPGHSGMQNTVSGEVIINMPRVEAWTRLQDLSLAHHYVPGLISTEITTDQKTGVGASRRVYQATSKYLNETVVEWDEGHGFTIRLHNDDGNAPLPFQQAWFNYRLSDYGNNQTRLNTGLRYQLVGGCLGYWMNKVLFEHMLKRRADDVPRNLKRFYETGRAVRAE